MGVGRVGLCWWARADTELLGGRGSRAGGNQGGVALLVNTTPGIETSESKRRHAPLSRYDSKDTLPRVVKGPLMTVLDIGRDKILGENQWTSSTSLYICYCKCTSRSTTQETWVSYMGFTTKQLHNDIEN